MEKAAKEVGVYTDIGVAQRDVDYSRGTLYCSQLYFGPDGSLLDNHRKLKPTGSERLIWGVGDCSSLPVFSTKVGRFRGLICWENYMPLARMALYMSKVLKFISNQLQTSGRSGRQQ